MNSLAKVNKKIAHTHTIWHWWIYYVCIHTCVYLCVRLSFSRSECVCVRLFMFSFICFRFYLTSLLNTPFTGYWVKSPRAAFCSKRQSSSLCVIHAGFVDNYPKRICPKLKINWKRRTTAKSIRNTLQCQSQNKLY